MAYAKFVRDTERQAQWCDLYRYGWTLAEIGAAYGVTRERVRQVIKIAGLNRKSGGVTVASNRRRRELSSVRTARRDARAMFVFGCSHAEASALNEGRGLYRPGTAGYAYVQQRRNAKARGIGWHITFPQWLNVWQESGHWAERGRAGSAYVMGRKDDRGPYAVANVYITTLADNAADYQAELKRRGVVCADGYKRLPERARKLKFAA